MLRPWFEHNNFSGWRLVRLEAWRGVRLEARPQEACPQEGCPLEACPLEGCPLEAEALILPDHQLEECPLEACPPGGLSAGEMTANQGFQEKVSIYRAGKPVIVPEFQVRVEINDERRRRTWRRRWGAWARQGLLAACSRLRNDQFWSKLEIK